MSREIDLTKKLTEDELRYLVDRDRWDDLRENARNLDLPEPNLPSARGIRAQVPRKQLRNTDAFDAIAKAMKVKVAKDDDEADDGSAPATPNAAQEDAGEPRPVDYTKLTVPQLKEEMDKRRAQYAGEQDAEGVELMTYANDARKDDLVSALKLDDEQEPEDGDN